MKNLTIGALVLVVVGLGIFMIVKKSPAATTANSNNNPATNSAANPAGQPQNPQATTNSTQVQAQEVTVGTGQQAQPNSVVDVLYVGKLPDGTVFDSSAANGNKPLHFKLGDQGLIAGFQIGVNGMKEGGERLIAIPPGLGYGAQEIKDKTGKVIIPANSTLVFDIKLVKATPGTAAAATTTIK